MPERCAFGIEITIDTFKRHKSSAIDQIRTGVIKQKVEVRSDICMYIYIYICMYVCIYMYMYVYIYIYTYLRTPWCRVLLEKLIGLQLVKKFPAFRGTQRFITALTSVRHLSLSWANPIQSIYPHPTSWRSFLILSTHLRLGYIYIHIYIYIYTHFKTLWSIKKTTIMK